jgi:hypothetical protein
MGEQRWERAGAAAGYVMIGLSAAAVSFERGAPAVDAPDAEVAAFFARYHRELLMQSLLFVLSTGAYVWFIASLRSLLLNAEQGPGTMSTVALGAGLVGIALNAVMQAPQVALAMSAREPVDPALVGVISDLMYALSVIAYVPAAVMLGAVAVVSLRDGAFPAWLGWLSGVAAAVHLVSTLGLVVESGPLVPGGPATYLTYALMGAWLVSATTTMFVRTRGSSGRRSVQLPA